MSMDAQVITLSDADIDRLADALASKQTRAFLANSPIWTREEAMEYCRIKSRTSWFAFCKRNELHPQTECRYARDQVERAIRREARMKPKRAA